MLLLIKIIFIILCVWLHLNTSNVTVNLSALNGPTFLLLYLNTSNVTVNLVVLMVDIFLIQDLNTSNVTVNHSRAITSFCCKSI